MMTNRTPQTPRTPKRDLYQEVTDKIIAIIERRQSEMNPAHWQRPWALMAEHGMPRNGATGRQYSGINALLLYFENEARGYSDCRHMTFLQASQGGYQIRKGAKTLPVFFYKQLEILELDHQTGDTTKKSIPFLTEYRVFNVEDIVGFEADKIQPPKWEPLAFVNQIVERLGVKVEHGNGDRACYLPATDTIRLPMPGAFTSAEAMAGVILHECAHAALHPSRLNRLTANLKTGPESSETAYAREELRAELASTFISGETNIVCSVDNQAAYLDSWLKVLKNDKHEIFRAASDATKIVNYMLGRTEEGATANKESTDQDCETPEQAFAQGEIESRKRRPLRAAMQKNMNGTQSRQPTGSQPISASP